MHLLALIGFTDWREQNSVSFHIPQLLKSPPFHIPEAWKRYPFQAEPPRIGHYREYPSPGLQDSNEYARIMKTAVKDAEGVGWGGVGGVVRHNPLPSPDQASLIFCLACFRDLPTTLAPGTSCSTLSEN